MSIRTRQHIPSDEDRDRARREAITWARQVVGDQSTVYLDTETTGLDERAEIIEISVLDCRGIVLFDSLVRPVFRIPPDAQAIHGISNEMVTNAPDWKDVFPYFLEVVHQRRVVVYNAEFDARIVQQMNGRHRITRRLSTWQCAMKQYSGYAGIWHERYGNYRFHKLDSALAGFGHPPGGHRALADARACKLVVEGMATSG